MRKIIILIFFFVVSTSYSQFSLSGPSAISVNAGFFLPYSSETFKSGIGIGFDIQHKVDPIYMFLNLTYNVSSRNNNVPSEYYNNTSGTGILEMSLGPRLYIGQTDIKYFVDGGLGMYIENKGAYEITINGKKTSHPSESNFSVGGTIGAGGEYKISENLDFVGRVKYHLYFGVGDAPFLNTYFGILGGIKYNFDLY